MEPLPTRRLLRWFYVRATIFRGNEGEKNNLIFFFFQRKGAGKGLVGFRLGQGDGAPSQTHAHALPRPCLTAGGRAGATLAKTRCRARGGTSSPQPKGHRLGGDGDTAPALPTPQVGVPQDTRLEAAPWGAPVLSGGSNHPSPSHGCSSSGCVPAEAGSKAGSDLDCVLLNNGEGARSLLLLARESRVFQSISFWE